MISLIFNLTPPVYLIQNPLQANSVVSDGDVHADQPAMENTLGIMNRETLLDIVYFISTSSPMPMDLEACITPFEQNLKQSLNDKFYLRL